MVSRMWLFGLILGIPLIGLAVAEGIQAHFNSEVRSIFRKQYPNADQAAISEITLDRICEKPDAGLSGICGTNANLNRMSAGALGAGVLGLVLLLAIRLAGSAARNRRRLLLYLFKPGLYLTAVDGRWGHRWGQALHYLFPKNSHDTIWLEPDSCYEPFVVACSRIFTIPIAKR